MYTHTHTHTHTHSKTQRKKDSLSLRNKREKAVGGSNSYTHMHTHTHTHTYSRKDAQTEENSIRLLWRAEGDEARSSKRGGGMSKFQNSKKGSRTPREVRR